MTVHSILQSLPRYYLNDLSQHKYGVAKTNRYVAVPHCKYFQCESLWWFNCITKITVFSPIDTRILTQFQNCLIDTGCTACKSGGALLAPPICYRVCSLKSLHCTKYCQIALVTSIQCNQSIKYSAIYMLDVLWCQQIKLIHIVSTVSICSATKNKVLYFPDGSVAYTKLSQMVYIHQQQGKFEEQKHNQRDRRRRALLQHQNFDFLFFWAGLAALHKASTI